MTFIPYHQHLLIKALCKKPFKSESALNEWFKKLVNKVGMAVVAGPTSVYVDAPGNEGLTGTITLATSHASIHIWDNLNPAMLQFDIYSCKKYDIQIVIDLLNEMELVSFDWMAIDRNDGLQVSDFGTGIETTYTSNLALRRLDRQSEYGN
jgi:S-adenosylmethionine/arginine decarboxylase-like enzyme